jgi:ribosomal protein S18 acetylase RimI-like enzyme
MHAPILPQIRRAARADEPALWEMLTFAASMTEANAVEVARESEYLASYVRGFGTHEDDWGVIAVDGAAVVAAAWLRLSSGEHAVATEGEPELAIAARPAWRGKGLGSRLMARLLDEAPFDAIVLSVRSTNPSVRLYQRYGFETVRSVVNRVGGESFVMRRPRMPFSTT